MPSGYDSQLTIYEARPRCGNSWSKEEGITTLKESHACLKRAHTFTATTDGAAGLRQHSHDPSNKFHLILQTARR